LCQAPETQKGPAGRSQQMHVAGTSSYCNIAEPPKLNTDFMPDRRTEEPRRRASELPFLA
jgi:hypothetical protein